MSPGRPTTTNMAQIRSGRMVVPKGAVTKSQWTSTKVYPGTVRDMWIYVPAQYEASKPACLLIVQDGGGYVRENGSFRTTVVMDNLIHKKENAGHNRSFSESGDNSPPQGREPVREETEVSSTTRLSDQYSPVSDRGNPCRPSGEGLQPDG